MLTKYLLSSIGLMLFGTQAFADPPKIRGAAARPAVETLEATPSPPVAGDRIQRQLATGDVDADVEHYRNLTRKLGVDLGVMLPFGDFQRDFNTAPMIGLHFTWEAIPPFSFGLGFQRASLPSKTAPGTGKLSMNAINIGAAASCAWKRFVPYAKLETAFYFNDVTFPTVGGTARVVTSGNDTTLTTLGINIGVGGDWIVGREMSFGIDITYHYSIPKKVSTSTGAEFDMGSPFATVALRLNF